MMLDRLFGRRAQNAMQRELARLLATAKGAKVYSRREYGGVFLGTSTDPDSPPPVTDKSALNDLRECLHLTGPVRDLDQKKPGCELLVLLDIEPRLLWVDTYRQAGADAVVRWGRHSRGMAVENPQRLLTWLAIQGAPNLLIQHRRERAQAEERERIQQALPAVWVPYLDQIFNASNWESFEPLLASAYPRPNDLCRVALEGIGRMPKPISGFSPWRGILMKIVSRQPVDVLRSSLQVGPPSAAAYSGFLHCILHRAISRPRRKLRKFSPDLRAALLARAHATLDPYLPT
jgi:hypothetical protein